jgi:hypothetical protein
MAFFIGSKTHKFVFLANDNEDVVKNVSWAFNLATIPHQNCSFWFFYFSKVLTASQTESKMSICKTVPLL